MTMTTRSRARTAAALAEEAGAVNDLHLSAAHQALSNRRQPPASVSQFRSFTARNPTALLTLHLRAFVVLQTQVAMSLPLVIVSPTVATPLWNVTNPVVSNGSALRMVPEMIRTTPETITTTTTTTMNFSTLRKS